MKRLNLGDCVALMEIYESNLEGLEWERNRVAKRIDVERKLLEHIKQLHDELRKEL